MKRQRQRHIDYLKDQLAAWDAQYQAIHIAGVRNLEVAAFRMSSKWRFMSAFR